MKMTINQKTNDEIYQGEDKTFNLYFYDGDTFEPVDLSAYDEFIVCLRNANATVQQFTCSTIDLTVGKISFAVTAAQSALLAVERNTMQVKFNVTSGPTTDIEVFTNYIDVKDPSC